MDIRSLDPAQAKRLGERLFPILNYLLRLKTRMESVGFPHDDKLYKLVCEAYYSVQGLSVEVHYLSCKSGVGKPSRDVGA